METRVDVQLVRRLLRAQFPAWSKMAIVPMTVAGVDNLMFRLGEDLIVRLPRDASSVDALVKEQAWLPRLSSHLPLATPTLRAIGEPAREFPWPWSVLDWIEGIAADQAAVADWETIALHLARFVSAMHELALPGGPAPGAHNFWRGIDIRKRDRLTREAVAELDGRIDAGAALNAWERDTHSGASSGPPQWMHGDIHGQNLLLRDGQLHAVIDFGCLGVGDPACDVAVAWRFLPSPARFLFREALHLNEEVWRRGRAWALSISVRELCAYSGKAPRLEAIAARTIKEIIEDQNP